MDADLTAQRAAALRALEVVTERLSALDGGHAEGSTLRRVLLDVADGVESALRRWLRDSEVVPIPVRLKAQSHEELREDAVLAELRHHDLLSVEVAASIHELMELRRRLGAGSAPEPEDERLARRAVHRLEMELRSPPPPARPLSPNNPVVDESPVHDVAPPHGPSRRTWMVGIAVAAVLVVGLIAAILVQRDDSGMAQGIALFRSGAYADAASIFWRYAEANPDDPTPHLYLARIHRRLGRTDLAGDAVRAALRISPADPDVQAEVGFLLLDTGQHETAVERFRSALRADPELATAWIGLVRALRAGGRDDAAERVLARAPERVREMFARQSGTVSPSDP